MTIIAKTHNKFELKPEGTYTIEVIPIPKVTEQGKYYRLRSKETGIKSPPLNFKELEGLRRLLGRRVVH